MAMRPVRRKRKSAAMPKQPDGRRFAVVLDLDPEVRAWLDDVAVAAGGSLDEAVAAILTDVARDDLAVEEAGQ